MNKIALYLPDDLMFISVTAVRAVKFGNEKRIQGQTFIVNRAVAELRMDDNGEMTRIYKFKEEENADPKM